MESVVTEKTPLVMLTIGQLDAYFEGKRKAEAVPDSGTGRKKRNPAEPEPGALRGKFAYGIRGIRQRYGVGHNTACSWASGLLAPAVIREGRKIILNTEKADQILEQWTQEQRQKQASK